MNSNALSPNGDFLCATHSNQVRFFEHAIRVPHTFEDLRRSQEGRALQPLIHYLSTDVDHPALINALLYVEAMPNDTERKPTPRYNGRLLTRPGL